MHPSVRPDDVPLADFRRIFVEHHDFVVRNLRRLGIADAQVDDAAQEVFLRVYRKYASFRGEAPLRAWIYGFVRRVAAWFRRTEQRRDRRHEAFRSHDRLSRSGVPQVSCTRLDASLSVVQLLQRMNARDREVFVLVELEGLTGRELAAHQQISVPAAQARIRAARQRAHEVAVRVDKASDHSLHPGLCAALLAPADVNLVTRLPELAGVSGGATAKVGWSVFVGQTLELKSASAIVAQAGGWFGTSGLLAKTAGAATGFALCTTMLLGADQLAGANAAVVGPAKTEAPPARSLAPVRAVEPPVPATVEPASDHGPLVAERKKSEKLDFASVPVQRRRRSRRPRSAHTPQPTQPEVLQPMARHASDAALRNEMRLLQLAVQAHDRGQTRQCRRLLRQLEEQFPAGLLIRERERLRQRLECPSADRPGPNCPRG